MYRLDQAFKTIDYKVNSGVAIILKKIFIRFSFIFIWSHPEC